MRQAGARRVLLVCSVGMLFVLSVTVAGTVSCANGQYEEHEGMSGSGAVRDEAGAPAGSAALSVVRVRGGDARVDEGCASQKLESCAEDPNQCDAEALASCVQEDSEDCAGENCPITLDPFEEKCFAFFSSASLGCSGFTDRCALMYVPRVGDGTFSFDAPCSPTGTDEVAVSGMFSTGKPELGFNRSENVGMVKPTVDDPSMEFSFASGLSGSENAPMDFQASIDLGGLSYSFGGSGAYFHGGFARAQAEARLPLGGF